MVPVPSARKRDECLAERDWPAVIFFDLPEKSHEVDCCFGSSDIVGGRFAAKCGSD